MNPEAVAELMANKSGEFRIWVRKLIPAMGFSVESLARQSGVNKSVINDALNDDNWSPDMLTRVLEAQLSVQYENATAIEADGFIPPKKWKAPRPAPPRRTLLQAVEDLEFARENADRESLLDRVFQSVVPERPAFLAVMTQVAIPSPVQRGNRHPARRAELFAAHDRGLMALFVTPNEERVAKMRERLRMRNCPTPETYREGVAEYVADYVAHLVAAGMGDDEAKKAAAGRIHHMPYDEFAPTAWLYTVSLIGESTGMARADTRVLERGPATGGRIAVVEYDRGHEEGIIDYLMIALNLTNAPPEFAGPFEQRLDGQY